MRDVIRRQQELNDLCRRNNQQAQARQRKKFDKKAAGAKAYSVGDYVWVFQNVIPPKETKKLLKKWRGPFMITEVHQEGRFYRLSTAEPPTTRTLSHTIHRQKTGVYPQTWKKGII